MIDENYFAIARANVDYTIDIVDIQTFDWMKVIKHKYGRLYSLLSLRNCFLFGCENAILKFDKTYQYLNNVTSWDYATAMTPYKNRYVVVAEFFGKIKILDVNSIKF